MSYRAAIVTLCITASSAMCADRPVSFNRDVRPILSDKCYGCHGPDSVAKKIPLRLDSEAAAKADLGGGRRAVADGNPAASQVIQRITAENKGMRMPPVYSGLKLSDQEIETLRLWIAQGAQWQKHWSFIPPERPPLPKISNTRWPRNPIDNFILARLDREGLAPAPEASRETLLRRVTLDLTGLPPTPAELDAFLADKSANAYEKVVDRLLASTRYGERMAERWLDGARYADSNGYQFDGERFMWRWRDWVIDAFNRNHRANTEDGIVPEEYAVEYVVDRIETTSTVFMGLTLGCARCHNHKYDPFTQKEFYQFFAYFNNVPENGRAIKYGNSPPTVPAPTRQQQMELAALETQIREAERKLPSGRDVPACAANPEACPAYWYPTDEVALKPKPEGTVTSAAGKVGQAAVLDGKSNLNGGDAGGFDIDNRFTLSAWINADSVAAGSILSKMTDNPQGKGYGIQLNNGKVHVHLTSSYATDAIRLETEERLEPKRWYNLTVTYNGSIMAEGVRVYIDGKPAKAQVLSDNLYRPFRNAGKPFKEPFRVGAGAGPANRFQGMIDGVHIYGRILNDDEIRGLALGEGITAIAKKPASARGEQENLVLRWYSLENAAEPEIRDAWKGLTALRLEKEKLESAFPTVMVMAESPVPKQTHMLIRGAYDKPGEIVQAGLPAVLPPLPAGAPNNRLGLAKWLVSPGNPLLARVTMNRFWQMYFGTGIVKTIEDFGSQGEWPSHPELLDWLATEFVRGGWDTKAMQKLIVTSAAYRQSSKATPELVERDPENRLLARGPRFRLPAEMIRDQALYAAGLLAEKIGGPSVKPYQPAGLWKELSMQDMDYIQSKGPDLYRRSLYIFWKRTIAPPMMMNFDAAQRESCVVRENRTNTPLQALDLMNDVTFVEAARFLGQRMIKEGGGDAESRLRYGFRLALDRSPSAAEAQILRDSLNYHRDYFAGKQGDPALFLKQGDSPFDPTVDRRDLAAYASVASLLLNMDEMVTKQ